MPDNLNLESALNLIGVESVHYKSKTDGHEVDGFNLYYTFEPNSFQKKKGMTGLNADKCFVPRRVFSAAALEIGDYFEIFYNKNGRIICINNIG